MPDPILAVTIPKGSIETAGPCWIPNLANGAPAKPLIRCKCGTLTMLNLYHVHADGHVTGVYHHVNAPQSSHNGKVYNHSPGCGWHVRLKLLQYHDGEFAAEE